jgi:hypothetical protein
MGLFDVAMRQPSVRAAAAATALGALACSSPPPPEPTPSYHEQISRWNGETEANLVTAWGVPHKTHVLAGGGRIIEYTQDLEGETACTTRFTLDRSGTIIRWWYTGNDCRVPRRS